MLRKTAAPKILAALGTAAAIAVCSTSPALADVTFSGTLDNATTQTNRISRDGVPSTCGSVKSYPGSVSTAARNYDAYTVTNFTGASQCYAINVTSLGANTFVAAYLGAFDPANISTNYRGDLGSSAPSSFGIDVPAGQTLTLVVSQVAGAGTESYSLTVVGPTDPVAVPTMTEWAMILMGLMLAGGAAVMIQRRRMAA
ncbi:IPTL-CTERM sorting domain-containing protein [Brevundimonas staleyi]|uniref:IPTL-CTERM sorting domain-containing protein n=2 Tax=Brevundimonas staleyi TaxID=74326 RepID=A0ABW0FRH9_9CAUL